MISKSKQFIDESMSRTRTNRTCIASTGEYSLNASQNIKNKFSLIPKVQEHTIGLPFHCKTPIKSYRLKPCKLRKIKSQDGHYHTQKSKKLDFQINDNSESDVKSVSTLEELTMEQVSPEPRQRDEVKVFA
jgi:hypothetical protein